MNEPKICLNYRISKSLDDEVEALKNELGISKTALIILALREYILRHTKRQKKVD